jgi:hypothetical protein
VRRQSRIKPLAVATRAGRESEFLIRPLSTQLAVGFAIAYMALAMIGLRNKWRPAHRESALDSSFDIDRKDLCDTGHDRSFAVE